MLGLGERHEERRCLQQVLDQALAREAVEHLADGGQLSHDVAQRRLADPDDVGLARCDHRGGTRLASDERHFSEERVLEQARHILFPSRRVDNHTQLAARHQEERVACISLPHDILAVAQTEHGERAQHRLKRLGAHLGQEGQRMILLLVAHENREIERGLVRLFDDMSWGTGVGDIPDFQHGRRIDRGWTYRKTRKLGRTRSVGSDQEGLDVVHRPA